MIDQKKIKNKKKLKIKKDDFILFILFNLNRKRGTKKTDKK